MFLICSDGERGMVLSVPQGSSLRSVRPPPNTRPHGDASILFVSDNLTSSTSVSAEVSVACSVVDKKYRHYAWSVFGCGPVHVESQPIPPFDDAFASHVRDETTKRFANWRP